jgi:cyclopropane fatty-acyl-phospholipid synthase-like methyltransferase
MFVRHVPHPADATSRLLGRQSRMKPLTYPVGVACEVAARALRRPKLTPRQNTKRCYETLFDPLCGATGVWPDYTEGYFPTGEETYDEAKVAQFDYILDQTGCGEGTRLLDLGCGNGKLLERARERGCEGSGITISSTQVATCRAEGLDVHLCSFQDAPKQFGPGTFDVVILNGPTEHFVSEVDAAEGKDFAIRQELFGILKKLLKPGGRVFITCIHFRHETDPTTTLLHPLKHQIGSYYFYCSNLIRIYSGWYLAEGTYQGIAEELGFKVTLERDATDDYYRTSQLWSERLQAYVKAHPGFTRRYLQRFFLQDPRYFFQAFLFWYYDPWTWQFRGGDSSPMSHWWLMFEAPQASD